MALFQGYRMFISSDKYVLQPSGPGADTALSLLIDRKQNDIKLGPSEGKGDKTMDVHAILGIISLQTSDYLVVVTSRKKVANILNSDVYMATDFRVLPIPSDAKRASLMGNPVEKSLLSLLKTHLYSAPFYFSYTYDLTSSMQRQVKLAESVGGPQQLAGLPMWQRADDRFFWNRHLQERLVGLAQHDPRVSRFIQPCLFGFLSIKSATINGRDFIFGLVARRSRFRAGTRYFRRGIDKEGHVSNFNETEQFVLVDPAGGSSGRVDGKIRLSYVQTRGSVPVYWAEVNNLRYKPDLLVMEKGTETIEAAKLHFAEQVKLYGDVYLVNLVNQSGYEKPIKDAYERLVQNLADPKVHYTYYDFHHECKGMKFERVLDLVHTLDAEGLKEDDYFHQDLSSTPGSLAAPVREQTAVLRTNCMDCLDRTNVVQSTFARAVLNKQLQYVGILKTGEGIEQHADFWHLFRNVWADHADVISKAYSGTGALKTDFTRTGKRSKEGALQDGINSITRYVKNNFFDGSRQDAYDLFTGAWRADEGKLAVDERTVVVRAMPWVAFFSLFMIFAVAFLPRDSTKPLTYFVAVWTILAIAALQFMVGRGIDYVDWPKLNKPIEAIFYEGPGYYSGRKGRAGVTGQAGRNMKRTERNMPVTNTRGAARNRRGYAVAVEQ